MRTSISQLELTALHRIQTRVIVLRNKRVLLDSDLATLYGIPTGRLNQTIGRLSNRFPSDFRFQLTRKEVSATSSHPAISMRPQHLTTLWLPWAFTNHGVMMAATVLHSPRAIRMSLALVRSHIGLKRLVLSHSVPAHRIAELEAKAGVDDEQLGAIAEVVRQLAAPNDRRGTS